MCGYEYAALNDTRIYKFAIITIVKLPLTIFTDNNCTEINKSSKKVTKMYETVWDYYDITRSVIVSRSLH